MKLASLLVVVPALVAAPLGTSPSRELRGVQAILQPSHDIEVGIPVSGVLARLDVELGQQVEAGQLLGELESSVEQASVALEAARWGETADLESAREGLAHARSNWERQRKVHEEGIVSDEVMQEATNALRLAETRLASVEETREQARLSHELALARLERRRIYAPISGVVTDKPIEPGELASPGGAREVLVRIVQVDPLVVDVATHISLRNTLAVGDAVDLLPEHAGEAWRTARVRAIGPVIDPASETFRVRLELPNPGGQLPAGLGCTVRYRE